MTEHTLTPTPDRVLQRFPEIQGVQWERNSVNSIGDEDVLWVGDLFTTLVFRQKESEGVYPLQGMHYRFDDRLTFVRKEDDLPIVVDMVDLRRGSPTARSTLRVACHPDPTRRLVIPREWLICLNSCMGA